MTNFFRDLADGATKPDTLGMSQFLSLRIKKKKNVTLDIHKKTTLWRRRRESRRRSVEARDRRSIGPACRSRR